MDRYFILTDRRRTLIALVHTLVFLALATRALLSPGGPSSRSGQIAFISIYLIVTSILGWLARLSTAAKERLYFGLCGTSAALGLLRAVTGQTGFQAAQYGRVGLLVAAALLAVSILRTHS